MNLFGMYRCPIAADGFHRKRGRARKEHRTWLGATKRM